MIHSSNTVVDRIVRAGLATPALALTILAGAAFAQTGGGIGRAYEVIVETDAPQDKADKKDVRQEVRTVVEINRTVDGKAVTVRRVNDQPIVVKLDGKQISKSHYKMKDGVVVITMPGSERTVEIAMPQHRSNSPFVGGVTVAEPVAPSLPAQVRFRGNVPGGWAQAADVAPEFQTQAQPKVMLGVVMAEPDGVILEHLGLDAKKAVLLERVVDGLPADKAGLQAKDIIIGFGKDAEPRSADDIRKVLAKAEPGTKVKVTVIRKGHPVTVDLKLEAFNAQALGRAPAPTVASGGQLRLAPGAGNQWQAFEEGRFHHHSHMEQAEKAMKEAAEMLARMERDLDHKAADAHKQASKAIEQAIAAMRQGEAFGLEVEDMRRMQQEAIERLRGDLGAQQNRRFWAEHGDEGFALAFPGEEVEDAWEDRIDELEERLDRLEQTFDRAIDRMEERTEAMIERLMERLERALDDREGRRGR